jgi:hypothetical protein
MTQAPILYNVAEGKRKPANTEEHIGTQKNRMHKDTQKKGKMSGEEINDRLRIC